MKKLFATFLLAVAASSASALTVTLEPAACGGGLWCASVPNDQDLNVLLYGSTNYQDVGIAVNALDGTAQSFMSVNYRGYSTIISGTCPAAPAVGTMTLAKTPMSGATGVAYVQASFSCTAHLGAGPRGGGWHQVWNLTTGTLTLP